MSVDRRLMNYFMKNTLLRFLGLILILALAFLWIMLDAKPAIAANKN